MSDYIPIPVAWARDIAEQGQKDIVIIVALDKAHGETHVTTFGKAAEDKIRAAEFGDVLGKHFTTTGERTADYEDWRLLEKAKLVEALNAAVRVIRQRHDMRFSPADPRANELWQAYYQNSPEMAPIREVLK